MRTKKKFTEVLAARSFAEEIENDVAMSAYYMRRAEQANFVLGKDHPIAKQEAVARDVYKRALLMVASGGMNINNGAGENRSASDNGLPAASYLAHGTRFMVEIPQGSGDALINWLTSGNPDVDGRSHKQTQNEATKENKAVYTRSAATHAVGIKPTVAANGSESFVLKEIKQPLLREAMRWMRYQVTGNSNHFGVDLAVGAQHFGGQSFEGRYVDSTDGENGHLYLHYVKPTQEKPGALLIGHEKSAPSSSQHSKLGKSDPYSSSGSSSFAELRAKLAVAGESEYQSTILPQKYNGMTMKLDSTKLEEMVKLNASDYGPDLARVIPVKSPQALQSAPVHIKPAFQPSVIPENGSTLLKKTYSKISAADSTRGKNLGKDVGELDNFELQNIKISYCKRKAEELKPGVLKSFIHFITFGFAFRGDFEKYENAIEQHRRAETDLELKLVSSPFESEKIERASTVVLDNPVKNGVSGVEQEAEHNTSQERSGAAFRDKVKQHKIASAFESEKIERASTVVLDNPVKNGVSGVKKESKYCAWHDVIDHHGITSAKKEERSH